MFHCVETIYLVNSGYPNHPGYLAPYKETKYHLPKYRNGPEPQGKKEIFNYAHSSLRNVIERSFGVLKMKWRMLLQMPSYPPHKQSQIIVTCMALHNFIRTSGIVDRDFDRCGEQQQVLAASGCEQQQQQGRAAAAQHAACMALHEWQLMNQIMH